MDGAHVGGLHRSAEDFSARTLIPNPGRLAALMVTSASMHSRRQFLCGFAGLRMASAVQLARPNIVVVLMDDLRWDELHCTGHPVRPHAEHRPLAAEGVTFRNAFVTSPLCSPSRACFLTGQYAHTTASPTIPTAARPAIGCRRFPRAAARPAATRRPSSASGTWASTIRRGPGFDHWVGFPGQGTYFDPELNVDGKHVKETGYTTDILTRYAVELLARGRVRSPLPLAAAQGRPSGTDAAGRWQHQRSQRRRVRARRAAQVALRRRSRCRGGPTPARRPSASRPSLRKIGNLPPLGPGNRHRR